MKRDEATMSWKVLKKEERRFLVQSLQSNRNYNNTMASALITMIVVLTAIVISVLTLIATLFENISSLLGLDTNANIFGIVFYVILIAIFIGLVITWYLTWKRASRLREKAHINNALYQHFLHKLYEGMVPASPVDKDLVEGYLKNIH